MTLVSRGRMGCAVAAVLLGTCGSVLAAPGDAAREYANVIAQAQADLDAGRTAEARRRLSSTEKSQRGFEYDYLLARAQAAGASGAAPDLVRTIPRPKAESRYGVL